MDGTVGELFSPLAQLDGQLDVSGLSNRTNASNPRQTEQAQHELPPGEGPGIYVPPGYSARPGSSQSSNGRRTANPDSGMAGPAAAFPQIGNHGSEILKNQLLRAIGRAEFYTNKVISPGDPRHVIKEAYNKTIPKLEDLLDDINRKSFSYSVIDNADRSVNELASGQAEIITDWIQNVITIAEEVSIHAAPLEAKGTLKKFTNTTDLNIYQFFDRFERLCADRGSKKDRLHLLLTSYLGDEPLVKAENQVRDYDIVKAHLIKEYGKPYDLVRVGLDEMEALPRPRNLDNNAKVYQHLAKLRAKIQGLLDAEGLTSSLRAQVHAHLVGRENADRIIGLLHPLMRNMLNDTAAMQGLPYDSGSPEYFSMLMSFLSRQMANIDHSLKQESAAQKAKLAATGSNPNSNSSNTQNSTAVNSVSPSSIDAQHAEQYSSHARTTL